MLTRPKADEYPPFYASYVARVPVQADQVRTLSRQRESIAALLAVPESKAALRYAPRKWSVKEVAGHLCDAERVFAYRLLRIARGDATPLAGFDEAAYARVAGYHRRLMAGIAAEWTAVRDATIALVRGLPAGVWTRSGVANGAPITARALYYVIVGHADHHAAVLRERYGLPPGESRPATRRRGR
jgi:hypothetical protein